MKTDEAFRFRSVIDEICELNWQSLNQEQMIAGAWAYYYFSVQFRENLKIARSLYPDDDKLRRLEEEECDTDNLSPWPGVAETGERMNHDEFMRRTLALAPADPDVAERFRAIGESYLAGIRLLEPQTRAASIASYEDGGLESIFRSILRFSAWNGELLSSFEHFLAEHVRFDSDPEQGHGALSRHMIVDDRILPLWSDFKQLLVTCVPGLVRQGENKMARIHELDGGIAVFPLGTERLDAYAPLHPAVGNVVAPDDLVHHS